MNLSNLLLKSTKLVAVITSCGNKFHRPQSRHEFPTSLSHWMKQYQLGITIFFLSTLSVPCLTLSVSLPFHDSSGAGSLELLHQSLKGISSITLSASPDQWLWPLENEVTSVGLPTPVQGEAHHKLPLVASKLVGHFWINVCPVAWNFPMVTIKEAWVLHERLLCETKEVFIMNSYNQT